MPVPEQRDAVDRHLLRDNAYSMLCEAIVDGTLQPGEPLHDEDLCGWLGLSRTPLRDALSRLAEDGLVEIAPQRYTRVSPLTARDAHDTFPLLAAVHALAAELGVPRLDLEATERLRAENDAFVAALTVGAACAAYEADDRFHQVFVDAAGNCEIERALRHMAPRLRRLEVLRTGALPGRRSVAQHEAILARAAAGDARGAASATRENWLELGGLVERSLARAG
ncbi:MAG TPA: GntR family transcriptional regulator [Baekduia sp.]|uniref:GntR family transcriptional regulator n=1 Tax=Baekduia sp. TaxID=2600305 RepID=UPI002BE3CF53|nr:GntR family transcriptional regulator [Baekduia sp.]HMJ32655.1 GntR family transcriptional regulator [Baekduia sp.]